MARIIVVGNGLSGLVASLVCQRAGFETSVVGRSFEVVDRRTTALFMPSIDFLKILEAWSEIENLCSPLKTMRIMDGTQRLIRARPATFYSSDIGLEQFGFNIPNTPLLKSLLERAKNVGVNVIKGEATDLSRTDSKANLTLQDGTEISADLVIAADGRHSKIRSLAQIAHQHWAYRQKAIVLTFQHQFPHQNISTEIHTETGPFTQVPLPGNRSSLVWAVRDGEENAILDKSNDVLNHIVEEKMQSMLGKIEIDSQLQTFPLTSQLAQNFAKDRVLLVGEAAHAFPPIGAQGLNLGLRDLMDMMECLEKCRETGNFDQIAVDYHRRRQKDIVVRTFAVDLFNRSLLTSLLPVQMARAVGLSAADNIPLLKQFLMRQGAGIDLH